MLRVAPLPENKPGSRLSQMGITKVVASIGVAMVGEERRAIQDRRAERLARERPVVSRMGAAVGLATAA